MKRYLPFLLLVLFLLTPSCRKPQDDPVEVVPDEPEPSGPVPVPVSGITLDCPVLELAEGESFTLTATVEPEEADDKSVSWESSDVAHVTVTRKGRVTAVKEGSAVVSVSTADGGRTASCTVTVLPSPALILYRTVDGRVLAPGRSASVGTLVSNTYADGWGRMLFQDPVTELGDGAFRDCTLLTAMTLPVRLVSIGPHAFHNCASLNEIRLPDSLESIGDDAFYLCTSLRSISLPEGVSSVGRGAFTRCPLLERFESALAGADGRYLSVDGLLTAFAPAGLTSYAVPSEVTGIGPVAFKYCTALEEITLPASVESVGDNAFFNCSALRTVTLLSTTPPSLGTTPFQGTDANLVIQVPAPALEQYRTAPGWKDYSDRIRADQY